MAIAYLSPGDPRRHESPARRHLNLHFERMRLNVSRYLWRYADRLVQSDGSYSDACISPQELRRILRVSEDCESFATWLGQMGVPSAQEIKTRLARLEEDIRRVEGSLTPDAVGTLPIEELRAGFMLSDAELDLVLAAAAPRLSTDMARLYAFAWADFSVRQPSAGFLCELISTSAEEAEEHLELLADGRPLMRFRLLVAHEHDSWKPATPRLHAPIEVPRRILSFLSHPDASEDGREGCVLHHPSTPDLASLVLLPEQRDALKNVLRRPHPRCVLLGPSGSGRGTAAKALAVALRAPLLEVDLGRALSSPATHGSLSVHVAEILREARIQRAAILLRFDGLEGRDLEAAIRNEAPALREVLRSFPGPLLATARSTNETLSALTEGADEIALPAPPPLLQRKLWHQALERHLDEPTRDAIADELSRVYRLPTGMVFRAVGSAQRLGTERKPGALTSARLVEAVRRQLDHRLGWLADAIAADARLSDVVLGSRTREQMEEILRYARQSERVFGEWGMGQSESKGQGLSILLAGPPGTGKTLLASVLARELGRILYRIDLSRIVDKYIGETEKNLGRVFDEAERAQAVLLFDEADSLFAKRTAIKSSNDRYANLEVNYLLQRLESFGGMSVLTTNLATTIDPAFERRIRFRVQLDVPDASLRAQLWRGLLPPRAPRARHIDFRGLAQGFELTGGHIRNAVIRAAVNAAEQGVPINGDHLRAAALAECRELGVLVCESERVSSPPTSAPLGHPER